MAHDNHSLIPPILMKIVSSDHMLEIDFCRPDARWTLLISDDRWDHVKRYVVGIPGVLNPLGERVIRCNEVLDFWRTRIRGQPEPHFLSLLLMPWVAHEEMSIGKVVFSSFPPKSTEELSSLVNADQSLAALIDVMADAGGEQDRTSYFGETWAMLDQCGKSPPSARCMFTRGGGLAFASGFEHVPRLLKTIEMQETDVFLASFIQRWRCIEGDLATGNSHYQKVTTNTKLHEPKDLTSESLRSADFKSFFSQMAAFDSYGVWKWCEATYDESGPSERLQRAWLAAKSLQTNPMRVPVGGEVQLTLWVTSLIALVHGLNTFRPNLPYNVKAPLDVIKREEFNYRPILKGIPIPEGLTPQCLAKAIRNWVNHPEQFAAKRAYVFEIEVKLEDGNVILAVKYSSTLPGEILRDTEKIGSARTALRELEQFCRISWDSATCTLNMNFKRV